MWGRVRSIVHGKAVDAVVLVQVLERFDDRSDATVYAFEVLRRRGFKREAAVVAAQYPGTQAALLEAAKVVDHLALAMGKVMAPAMVAMSKSITESFAAFGRACQSSRELDRIIQEVNQMAASTGGSDE